MKQVSNTKNLLVLSSSIFQSINPRNLFGKYRLVLLLMCITLFISNCKKDDHPCKKTVPLIAVFQTESVITQAGPLQLITATGTGDGTPIGKSSFVGHGQIDANNIFTEVDGIITVANGDQLFETGIKGVSPVVDPATGNILLIYNSIITGGTGKYAGATGSYTTIFHGNLFNPAGIDSLKGTIILDECHGNK
ncbi:MAG: hypothetical protein WKF97_18930 [Chitinophagaceae bacterium]